MEDRKLYERLRQLRTQHGETQETLAEKLGVNPQAVKSWEKYKNSSDPKLENLLKMCELYNCDLDYLIGRIETRTHDIMTACEITGLSEIAIEKITKTKERRSLMAATLSKLIETEYFYGFMTAYRRFLDSANKLMESNLEPIHNQISDIDTVILSREDATRFFMKEVSDMIIFICEEEYKRSWNTAIEKKKENEKNIIVEEEI